MKDNIRDPGLTPRDDMVSAETRGQEEKLPRIHGLSLGEIDDFPDHPYAVRKDEDMTRDEAILLMVDSNVQRSNILPSEKVKAYKIKRR